jgi:hypothetical protein
MQTKLLTSTALAAVIALPMSAAAATKEQSLTVTLTVNPIILLFVEDTDLSMTASDITTAQLDGRGQSVSDGRAEFFVAANTGYDLIMTPDQTWGNPGAKKVKFVEEDDNELYLAGTLFLDTDISNDDRITGDTDIVTWNALAGLVSHTELTRGVRRYGVGAIFDPTDWSGAADDTLAGAPSGAVSIAPPGSYSSIVTITVSDR